METTTTTHQNPRPQTCQWVINRYSVNANRQSRRCSRAATTTVIEYGRTEHVYCERHASLAVRDFDGQVVDSAEEAWHIDHSHGW